MLPQAVGPLWGRFVCCRVTRLVSPERRAFCLRESRYNTVTQVLRWWVQYSFQRCPRLPVDFWRHKRLRPQMVAMTVSGSAVFERHTSRRGASSFSSSPRKHRTSRSKIASPDRVARLGQAFPSCTPVGPLLLLQLPEAHSDWEVSVQQIQSSLQTTSQQQLRWRSTRQVVRGCFFN